jgi:hypothetical protein
VLFACSSPPCQVDPRNRLLGRRNPLSDALGEEQANILLLASCYQEGLCYFLPNYSEYRDLTVWYWPRWSSPSTLLVLNKFVAAREEAREALEKVIASHRLPSFQVEVMAGGD